jgi:putative transposase
MAILNQHETGMSVADLAQEYGCSTAMIYQWRSKFGGMDASLMKRMKELEAENARLKKMYAEERSRPRSARKSLRERSRAIWAVRDGPESGIKTWRIHSPSLRMHGY